MTCLTCHQPHREGASTADGGLRISNLKRELCLACHRERDDDTPSLQVLSPPEGGEPGAGPALDALARRLYGFASAGGMRSLGLPGGELAPGEPADFLVVDLEDPAVAGSSAEDLLANVVFSACRSAVRDVFVAGEPVVVGGASAPGRPEAAEVAQEFRATMRKLWG
jgi:predicted CXXCH cytochrome family protein